ncbi:hypothetical protein E6R60_06000 [Streptomyces sp. A0642]|uniref:hypothetical protein n=1 Tax=Streptomyces sp. A0642 TaxID=2563100 RepID=UPI0010A29550|nr:hypothetical protein [Streptomyces sp. A0642]THA78432.1 hypothetical protein E6R60_06000 [Streptomyces sp. A0642]
MAPSIGATFAIAAKRHFQDASELNRQKRHASADHLAGFAAECALKAIILDFLGGQANKPGAKPSLAHQGVNHSFGHLPPLWGQVALVMQGRGAGSQFAILLNSQNPYSRWNVSDRYQDGRIITAQRVNDHLTAARKLLSHYQQAQINGSLT